ncbi:FtsK/SpoIIIE domain-containing protein [Streptomyces sp. NPDC101062]|uniref:FtsK/SpoIIIE domain-containing protein n=1 Tax=unclassified Streptomyces TaxID=2593676 RepID=UPI00382BBFCF
MTTWEVIMWVALGVLSLGLVSQWWWQPRLPVWLQRPRGGPWLWYLVGYPSTVLRVLVTWRKVCQISDLSVVRRPRYAMVGKDSMVRAVALRPLPPRLGLPLVTSTGLAVRVHLHPGQTPGQFIACADAFAHAWRMHSVRVISDKRGQVLIMATARNPLEDMEDLPARQLPPARVLSTVVGRVGDASPWEIDFRKVPHWLVAGATQSGKSTLLAALVTQLGHQRVALVGIDCKGGLELGLFSRRLSALATSRPEAVDVLTALVTELENRMRVCRSAGVRSIWEIHGSARPVPVVVIVDEIAELYLAGSSLAGRKEAVECSTLLLRLAQLGAALGMHLVVAAQRFGSELGPGATALRAQLGGRICHRVHDEATAEMTLGDLSPDAVDVALAIGEDEQGVAVTTVGGHWQRARSWLITPDEAARHAARNAHHTPHLDALAQGTEQGGDTT